MGGAKEVLGKASRAAFEGHRSQPRSLRYRPHCAALPATRGSESATKNTNGSPERTTQEFAFCKGYGPFPVQAGSPICN